MITTSINRGKRPFYNVAEFICDYQSDVANLPTHKGPGSVAYVVENGNKYVLNSQHQWIKQPTNSGSGSGSGGSSGEGDIVILNGNDNTSTNDDIVIL